jgi:uncharacterized protein (TIGR02186 family)
MLRRGCALLVLAFSFVLLPGLVVDRAVFDGPLDRAEAQTAAEKRRKERPRRKAEPPPPAEAAPVLPGPAAPPAPPAEAATPAQPAAPPATMPREKVEADVSTRSIAVTSGFTGTEIIVFGSVDHSRQTSAEAGYYDIVVVVEGTPAPLIARKKSNVAGLWINTASAAFVSVPSYYAITSTRPLEEIASEKLLQENAIGLSYVRMTPMAGTEKTVSEADIKLYKSAVIRVKQKDDLYLKDDYGVAFIGRSLFRSSIELPANVPLGPLTARVYLLHDGEVLSSYSTSVRLEREGVELFLYHFAIDYPLLYGLFAVLVAVGAGLLASALFRRRPR